MIPSTTLQLIQYYANLLIFQYVGLNNSYNTITSTVTPIVMAQQSIQNLTFSPSPNSGTFVLSYGGIAATTINWNDVASTIQTDLQTIPDLSQVTVSGSINNGLTVNFVGVTGVASLLLVQSNNLSSSGNSVSITISETDLTLPLAVQNGFNLGTATGIQLDIIGKYVGVVRTITTPTQTIVLDDSDFTTLIKFAIAQNNAGSSLLSIETNLNVFFPGQFIITDFKNMTMSYVLSGSLGSANLFTCLIQEGLLPKPMGVGINIFIPPIAEDYFGYSTYQEGGVNPQVKPYNTYESFNNTWLYLDYTDIIT